MNRGRFCEILFPVSFCHPRRNPTENSFQEQKFSIPLSFSYENCKSPRRNQTPKRENCFSIFISVCNFHISMQFSPFGVLLLRGCLQFSHGFAIFIWVCNFHISLQFSRHNSSTSYVRGFVWIPCHMNLNSLTPCQPRFSVEETKKN